MNTHRVLYIVNALGRGGLEVYLLRFIQHLNNNGIRWEHHVLCTSGKSGQLEMSYRQEGAKVFLHRKGYINVIDHLRMFRTLKAGRYNAVCDFSEDFSGPTLFLAKKAGIKKRIASYRGWLPLYRQDPLRVAFAAFMRRVVRAYASDILSNSKACFELLFPDLWRNDDRFMVIRNGIPIKPFLRPFDGAKLRNKLKIPSDKYIVGHVGRYDKSKNHKTILEVAKRLQDMHRDDIIFLFIGNAVPENIHPLAERLGLHNVICSPVRNDIPDILRILDAFIFPSVTEGQPNALLEAMFGCLPFVASNIPSIKECVHPDAHDWLFDPLDAESMVHKIILMIDNLEKFKYMASRIQPWICERHDAFRCFDQLADCLQTAVKR